LAGRLLDQPVPAVVYPLLVDGQLHTGDSVVVVAARLPVAPHDVLFVLGGPSCVRYERLVHAVDGIAVARVSIPKALGPGEWGLGAEDLSSVHTVEGRLGGRAQLDLAIFHVPA
jgi:hypothetical protein